MVDIFIKKNPRIFKYDESALNGIGTSKIAITRLYISIFRNEYILMFMKILEASGKNGISRNSADDGRVYNILYNDYLFEVNELILAMKKNPEIFDTRDMAYIYENQLGYNKFDYEEKKSSLIGRLIY